MLESQYELYISMIFEKFQILHPVNLCNSLSDILKVPLVFSGLFRVVSNLFLCLTKNLHRLESKLVCNKPNRIDTFYMTVEIKSMYKILEIWVPNLSKLS